MRNNSLNSILGHFNEKLCIDHDDCIEPALFAQTQWKVSIHVTIYHLESTEL